MMAELTCLTFPHYYQSGVVKKLPAMTESFQNALKNYKIYYTFFATAFILLTIPLTLNLVFKSDQVNHDAHGATSVPGCWPTSGSGFAGTLTGQPNAIWCYTDYGDGPSTAVKGNNTWVDNFNHGLTLSKFNADVITDAEGYPNFRGRPNIQDYTDFPETGSICKSQLFRHGNHWMRDIAGHDQGGEGSCAWDFGGAVMSPNKTFRAEKPSGTICTPQNVDSTCKLVIEADAATRVSAYGGNLFWPEFVITTADHPVRIRQNGTYDYEFFPNSWTLGCRLQNDGGFTCALLDDGPGGDTPSRVYEISHFQCGNSEDSPHPGSVYGCNQKYGGLPANLPVDIAGHSRNCENLDPDTNCRDRWRWEITNNRLTWFANGAKYMEHSDFKPAGQAATNNLLTQPVYVYFGEFMYKLGKPARMHWDRIAINPKNPDGTIAAPSAAETFCLGQPNNTCGSGTPPPPPGDKIGDLNKDGAVNILDLSILLSKFGSTDPVADINKDGKVDTLDLSTLLSKWGT